MGRSVARLAAWSCASALLGGSAHAIAPQVGEQIRTLRAEVAAAGGRSVVARDTGYLRFVSMPADRPLAVVAHGSAEERARAFLARYGEAFGLGIAGGEAVVERVSAPDEAGMEHVRLRQARHGVPVTGGEMTLHLRHGGVVAALVRALPGLERIDTTPRLSAGQAAAIAARGIGRARIGADASWSRPRLEIFSRPLIGGPPFPARLAWFLEARRIDLRELVWIDAGSGVVLHHFSQLTDARDREVYDAAGGSTLPGTLVRGELDPATGDPDEDAAFDFAGDTYDYYSIQHGRDSYDGAGSTIRSTTAYCPSSAPADCPYPNAFWNGTQMVYGAGFPAADDVDAHELTHAVTEYTAHLFYYMQSGALNESYSDIFGETIDQTNGAGTDTAGVRWLLGEDVPGFGAIRDMEDPTIFGDPGKMSDAQFACPNYFGDAGGVHTNSGVSNHAYALAVDGGTYNSQTVSGIGLAKAGKIWYRALSQYLVSSSDFEDMDAVIRQSCSDLIGTASITAGNCTEVGKALDAVEMADPWPCLPSQASTAASCPAGMVPGAYLFREDVEDAGKVASDWTVAGTDGVWANQGFSLGEYATSGTQSFWGYDPALGVAADARLQMARDVQVAGNDTYLSFHHSFGFEFDPSNRYDGGVVESSSNSGGSWSDAGALIDAGAAYNGSIATGFGNPLAGSSAFTAYSWGYTSTRLSLASKAGQSFRLRFRLAADDIFDDYGWFIDDIVIYRCFPDTLLFADGFEIGSTSEWSGP